MVQPISSAWWVDSVQTFWFEELERAAWFTQDSDIDAIILARFLALHEHVVRHLDCNVAAISSEQAVASVIVLDQFPRNMFRGTPQAFATDHLALALAYNAIDQKLDHGLDKNRRLFLYLPFEHSEELTNQNRAVALISDLGDDKWTDYAIAHRDIIARFGRFPHRNVILGRPSTPDEIEFLQQSDDAFWTAKGSRGSLSS